MLDPNIILRGQQQNANPFESAAQGIQFGQGLRQLLSGRQSGKMQQLATSEERQAFADKSMFSRELNSQIKADQAAQVAQAMALQKHNADIYGTKGKGAKDFADAGKADQEADAKRYELGSQVFQTVATGGLDRGKQLLNYQLATGAIDQSGFDALSGQLAGFEGKPLGEMQTAAFNQAKAMLDPKYSFQTQDNSADNLTSRANTVANNAQSDVNNQRTTQASMYSTDVGAQTADKNREQQGQQFNQNFEYTAQQDEIKNGQGELKEFGGKGYIVYKDGSYRPAVGADGKQISTSKSETPEQKMERIDNALGSADGAKAAARASQDAAALINHPGLYWGTGSTNSLGMVPGSDAKEFHVKLENLKAQVFLPTVKALQGMGALSNAEGEKISSAVANLDPKIGPDAMREQLSVLAKQMSEAAKSANKRTQNFASRGGTTSLTTKPPATQPITEQRSQAYKGVTTSLSDVKQAAQKAGISTEEMVSILKSQGAIIK